MFLSQMPVSVWTFFQAMKNSDICGAMSALCQPATLKDEHRVFVGDDIAAHLHNLAGTQLPALIVVNAYERGGRYVLTIISGAEQATIANWHFVVSDGGIVHVEVSAIDLSELSGPVNTFIDAVNTGDFTGFMATFADDALVNDQLCDHWGREKIARWASLEIIGEKLRIRVIDVVKHYGQVIVTATVDGTFEKKGLPDPLVLTFYFSSSGDKIAQLMILRNHTTA